MNPAILDTAKQALEHDRINSAVFQSADITDHYPVRGLDIAESIALLRHQPAFMGRAVLDIGIGTGRTTKILASVCERYVGVDYSEPMVQYVKQTLPEIEVRVLDMRVLQPLADQSFDFVFAPNNVIDAVTHLDRLTVLSEVRRVLRPGGLFAFSSHNRRAGSDVAQSIPKLNRSRNPLTQLSYWRQYRQQMKNFRQLQPRFQSASEYEIHNDIGHDFSLLFYFIDHHSQRRQLTEAGFTLLDVIDRFGKILDTKDLGVNSVSLLYVARRRGANVAT